MGENYFVGMDKGSLKKEHVKDEELSKPLIDSKRVNVLPIPKLNFKPCNTYLLCRKVEIDEKVGNIILADPDKWQKRFEVVATSPNLFTYIDKYEVGNIVIYPVGQPTMFIEIDGESYFFLDKRYVVSKV